MPPHEGETLKAPRLSDAMNQMKSVEESQSIAEPLPPAFIFFFKNHPYHYVGNEDVEPRASSVFCGINMPELKGRPNGLDQQESVFNHTRIPDKFD
jgi:hypothetical protein